MTYIKYVEPEGKTRDVCIKIDPKLRIESHGDWAMEVGDAAWAWPSFVKESFFYWYQGDTAEYKRLHAFMEKGVDQEALIYHRHGESLSWIVIDEYAYAHLCHSLHIDRDFILKDDDSGIVRFVPRKPPREAETPSTPVEPDNKPATT